MKNWIIFFIFCTHTIMLGLQAPLCCTKKELKRVVSQKNQNNNNRLKRLQLYKNCFFWHTQIPYIGLSFSEMYINSYYPKSIAWNISLWDLAPKKGAGILVALIDTGINYKHPDICNVKRVENFLKKDCDLQIVNKSIEETSAYFEKAQTLCNQFNFDQIAAFSGTQAFISDDSKSFDLDDEEKEDFSSVSMETFLKGHGTGMSSIIIGKPNNKCGVSGISPNANLVSLKAFDENGISSKENICSSLKIAKDLSVDIVVMGLKISQSAAVNNLLDQEIENLLHSFNYVVAASGNDAQYCNKESYPASSKAVFFSVGACSFDKNKRKYNICDFSQYSMKGPNFVAPGKNILSAWSMPKIENESCYALLSGTSIATAIIAAELALIVSEFKSFFSRKQIEQVICTFAKKPSIDKDWKNKVVYGLIDLKSSLLCLHIVDELFKNKEWKKDFSTTVAAVYTIMHTDNKQITKKNKSLKKIKSDLIAILLNECSMKNKIIK